jgi:enamine deaminase RidA (YjgF/YER057c/UK114 family)
VPKKASSSPKLYNPPRGGVFSSAIEAPRGRIIYVSGLTSRNKEGEVVGEGDITLQTETVLSHLRTILEEAGATLDDVVKVTVFIRHMEEFRPAPPVPGLGRVGHAHRLGPRSRDHSLAPNQRIVESACDGADLEERIVDGG